MNMKLKRNLAVLLSLVTVFSCAFTAMAETNVEEISLDTLTIDTENVEVEEVTEQGGAEIEVDNGTFEKEIAKVFGEASPSVYYVDGTIEDDTTNDGSEEAPFKTLAKAITAAGNEETTITLLTDITELGQLIDNGQNITINLNNHTITAATSASNYNFFEIVAGAVLTIDDQSSSKNGTITSEGNMVRAAESAGTINLKAGTISTSTPWFASGIYLYNNGVFNMTGGEITGCQTQNCCGGVYVNNGATFNMSGGEIRGNIAPWCGGVYVKTGGTFNMSGGVISDHIINNQNVGGVYVDGGTFNMTGGTISGNTVTTAESATVGNGGGVYNAGTFTMTGGEITSNEAGSKGGGVYNIGTMTVGGTAKVTGNIKKASADTTGTANNVEQSGKTLQIGNGTAVAAPADGMSIGITKPAADTPLPYVFTGSGATDEMCEYFISDDPQYPVVCDNSVLQLVAPAAHIGGTYYPSLRAAVDDYTKKDYDDGLWIYLLADNSETFTVNRRIILSLEKKGYDMDFKNIKAGDGFRRAIRVSEICISDLTVSAQAEGTGGSVLGDAKYYFSGWITISTEMDSSGSAILNAKGETETYLEKDCAFTATPAAGFQFEKWTYSINGVDKGDISSGTTIHEENITGNIVFTAHFKALPQTVTFDSNGGTEVSPKTREVLPGQKLTKPSDPTREGFNFAGWAIGKTEELWDFDNDIVEEDVTLTALWTEIPEVKITFEISEGIETLYFQIEDEIVPFDAKDLAAEPKTFKQGDLIILVKVDCRSGYACTMFLPDLYVVPDDNDTFTVTAVRTSDPSPTPVRSDGNDTTPLFTGTWNNAVTGGSWTQDSNGIWHYTSTEKFRATWGYIANPYAGEGQNTADWFWFDIHGNMLTGWQYINGKWYYLNPTKDGTLGACLIGPAKTPDGYEVDETGAWTGH